MIDIKPNTKMSAELKGTKHIRDYVLGGHGVVTLKSSVSNKHYTYWFDHPSGVLGDKMFIKVLGDDNTWIYVGMFVDGRFRLTKASKFGKETGIVRGVAFILKSMYIEGFEDSRMKIYHEGVCSRCGRPLTSPVSLETGIGPVCRRAMGR